MQTGKPPEALRMPTPGNPEDAHRWLEDVIQRSEEAAADLGFLKPWFQDEFWQDNPHYSAGTIRVIKTSFAYAGQVWGHKALRHIRKRDLVAFADFLRDHDGERGKSLTSRPCSVIWEKCGLF